jgi:hypothetical protein
MDSPPAYSVVFVVQMVGYLVITMMAPLASLVFWLMPEAVSLRRGVWTPAGRVKRIVTVASAAMALCVALVGFGFRCAGVEWFQVSIWLMVVSIILGWFWPLWFGKDHLSQCGQASPSARGIRPPSTWAIWVSRLLYVVLCCILVYIAIS